MLADMVVDIIEIGKYNVGTGIGEAGQGSAHMKHRFHHVIAIGGLELGVHHAGKHVAVAAGELIGLPGQLGLFGAFIYFLGGSIKSRLNALPEQFIDVGTVAKSGNRANLLRVQKYNISVRDCGEGALSKLTSGFIWEARASTNSGRKSSATLMHSFWTGLMGINLQEPSKTSLSSSSVSLLFS